MDNLKSYLEKLIAKKGPISISEYMRLCLGDPRYGYYMTKNSIGREGDFITAPEISQMFGEIIGIWAVLQWQVMGKPKNFFLIELGPGRGTLMADLLHAVKTQVEFIEAMELHLVEISPLLRAKQKAVLSVYKPAWCSHLDDVPKGPSILIANEFFDALPIKQFQRTNIGWYERMVGLSGKKDDVFEITLSTHTVDNAFLAELPVSIEQKIAEISQASNLYLQKILKRIRSYSGAVLIIDYGYSENVALNSLQATRKHHYVPIFSAPGKVDLTAHVNFYYLLRIVTNFGCFMPILLTQRQFLEKYGINQRMEKLIEISENDQAERILADHNRLTGMELMGHLFKALALSYP